MSDEGEELPDSKYLDYEALDEDQETLIEYMKQELDIETRDDALRLLETCLTTLQNEEEQNRGESNFEDEVEYIG